MKKNSNVLGRGLSAILGNSKKIDVIYIDETIRSSRSINVINYLINKKKQIALTKNNQISFLKNFKLPAIKETNSSTINQNWIFLKNYKNSISNLKLNINLYYKFSNKLPPNYKWYSLKENKEFIPSFTKNILRQVSTLF